MASEDEDLRARADRLLERRSSEVDAEEAREAILEAELAKREARIAELERDVRAAAEAKLETYPPKVIERHPGPPTSVAPPSSAPQRGATGQQGQTGARGAPASKVMQWTAFVAAITALVATVGQIFKPDTSKEQAAYAKTEQAYEAIRAELVKANEAIAKNGENDETRWGITVGTFAATGVKFTSAPGAPPVEPVPLAPAPMITKVSPKSASMIQVLQALPSPAGSVAPVQLPENLESLPTKKP